MYAVTACTTPNILPRRTPQFGPYKLPDPQKQPAEPTFALVVSASDERWSLRTGVHPSYSLGIIRTVYHLILHVERF